MATLPCLALIGTALLLRAEQDAAAGDEHSRFAFLDRGLLESSCP